MKVEIDYTNWKNERAFRRIPINVYYGSNEFHPEQQWLMEATDLDKNALRCFAMKDIHSWRQIPI